VTDTPLLELRDVCVEFGGIRALSDINLAVQQNDLLAIIGPNGSGKTTLLNAVLGYYLPSSGAIRFAGRRLDRELPHARIAMGMARSFQHVDIFNRLTVEQVLLLGLHSTAKETFLGALLRTPGFRRTKATEKRRVSELVEALGLGPVLGRRMSELPYGPRKMVDVARAVASEPRLVLLDEPSSGVSLDEREDIVRLLRNIHSQGTALILIEHDMSVVQGLAQRVVALNFGQKIAEGTYAEVSNNPILQSAYFQPAAAQE
jgi:ABC-type branched-subunit amino acid transport system ATPase component